MAKQSYYKKLIKKLEKLAYPEDFDSFDYNEDYEELFRGCLSELKESNSRSRILVCYRKFIK